MFSSRSVSRQATGSWNRHSGLNECSSRVLVVCAMTLDMNRAAVDGQRSLHHGLAQRRMRVDVAPQLPGVALEQLCERRLGDELGGAGADDVRAEHLTRRGVG